MMANMEKSNYISNFKMRCNHCVCGNCLFAQSNGGAEGCGNCLACKGEHPISRCTDFYCNHRLKPINYDETMYNVVMNGNDCDKEGD